MHGKAVTVLVKGIDPGNVNVIDGFYIIIMYFRLFDVSPDIAVFHPRIATNKVSHQHLNREVVSVSFYIEIATL